MLYKTYEYILAFDFETSGLSPYNDRIIEIGAILLKREDSLFKVEKELNCLIKQSTPLPSKIVEITGITDELLNDEGISESEAFHRFLEIYKKDALLVAYNLSFDYAFLVELFRRHYNDNTLFIHNDILDVMAVYKDRHPYPHRLDNVVETYNISVVNTHRALDDVKATILGLIKMSEERNTISKYINVIGYNPRYGPTSYQAPHVSYVAQYGNRLEIEKR